MEKHTNPGFRISMLTDLDALAFRFFKLFAQYEYALKVMSYATAGPAQQVKLEWDRFASEIGAAIMEVDEPSVVEARGYILEHPPKRQIWVGGAVQWQPVSNEIKTPQMLFAHIRRVRNNLYHGGKFNLRWIDPDRNEELMSKSLLLLQTLVGLNQTLDEAIKGNVAA